MSGNLDALFLGVEIISLRENYFMSSICRARLMARVSRRWCCAGKPVYLRGRILPSSVTYRLKSSTFLGSKSVIFTSTSGLGLGVWRVVVALCFFFGGMIFT